MSNGSYDLNQNLKHVCMEAMLDIYLLYYLVI